MYPGTIEVNLDGVVTGNAGDGGDVQLAVILVPHRGPGLGGGLAADQLTALITDDIQSCDHVRRDIVLVTQTSDEGSFGTDLEGVGVVLVGDVGVAPVGLVGALTHLEYNSIRGDKVTTELCGFCGLIGGSAAEDGCTAFQLNADGVGATGNHGSDLCRVLIGTDDLSLVGTVNGIYDEPLTVRLRYAVIPGQGKLLRIDGSYLDVGDGRPKCLLQSGSR